MLVAKPASGSEHHRGLNISWCPLKCPGTSCLFRLGAPGLVASTRWAVGGWVLAPCSFRGHSAALGPDLRFTQSLPCASSVLGLVAHEWVQERGCHPQGGLAAWVWSECPGSGAKGAPSRGRDSRGAGLGAGDLGSGPSDQHSASRPGGRGAASPDATRPLPHLPQVLWVSGPACPLPRAGDGSQGVPSCGQPGGGGGRDQSPDTRT